MLAALAAGPRRKLAGTAALTYGLLLAASTLLLGLTSHGWYVYYVFEQMGEQSLKDAALGQFWTVSLLPVLGIAVGAAVLGARRTPPELLAGCAALVVAGYAALVHGGGTVNDLLPAYFAVALLAGLAMGGKPGGLAAAGTGPAGPGADHGLAGGPRRALGRRHGQRAGRRPARGAGERFPAGPGDPGQPGPRRRGAPDGRGAGARRHGRGARRSRPGPVAGLPAVAHQGAVADVLRATDRAAIASFTRSAARAVAMRQFSAIIIELNTDLDGFPADLNRYYRRCPQMLLSGVPAAWFRPVTGARARPAWVWLPAGRGSCAAVASLLDGCGAGRTTAQPRRPAPSGGAS